jgi:hypothetical protein
MEACWHLFGYPIIGLLPNVYHLPIHMENHQLIKFRANTREDIQDAVNAPLPKTELMAFLN